MPSHCKILGAESPAVTIEPGVIEVCSGFEGRPISYMAGLKWELYDFSPLTAGGQEVDPASAGQSQPLIPATNRTRGFVHVCQSWENFEQVGARAVATVQMLAAKYRGGGKEVVVTTHGDVAAALRLWAAGQPVTVAGRRELMARGQYPTYCAITSLQIGPGGDCIGHELHSIIDHNPDGKKV